MTFNQLAEFATLADQGKLQVWMNEKKRWEDYNQCIHPALCIVHSHGMYRAKPETKLRPWTPEEVPLGAQYRGLAATVHRQTILGVSGEGINTSVPNAGGNNSGIIGFEEMLDHYQHSVDGGKTWLPCGVLEE